MSTRARRRARLPARPRAAPGGGHGQDTGLLRLGGGRPLSVLLLTLALLLGPAGGPGWAGAPEALEALRRRDYATAVREVRPLAQHGDAAAQALLGFLYTQGAGVPRDDGQAAQWFQRAAAQGHPRAQYYLGVLASTGRGLPQDHAQAAQWFQRAAAQGEARAQLGLGRLYAQGQGLPRDEAQAAQWLRRAADQGLAAAQYGLGVLYAAGRGVPQDLRQAAQWYERAAAQGEAAAQYNLGRLLSLGQGVPQDLRGAHLWLSLAATGLPPGPQRTAAGQARDLLVARLSPAQRAAAQARVQAWQPRREGPLPDVPDLEPPARGAPP